LDISDDNWEMVLDFFLTTKGTLNDFEDEGFWPVIIDDFIEYLEKR